MLAQLRHNTVLQLKAGTKTDTVSLILKHRFMLLILSTDNNVSNRQIEPSLTTDYATNFS